MNFTRHPRLAEERASLSEVAKDRASHLSHCFILIPHGGLLSTFSVNMTSRSPATIALYTTGAILTGLVGYAVYFDYMRRNSPEFRKNLSTSHLGMSVLHCHLPQCADVI